ncbi:hypothetical protein TSOC_015351, partial [Tetrabaena socialis]
PLVPPTNGSGAACDPPTASWCENSVSQRLDCDGDGVEDWVCMVAPIPAKRGVIRSTGACIVTDDKTGWPNAPDSYCPVLLTCDRPTWWCGSHTDEVLRTADCDGDGITDY